MAIVKARPTVKAVIHMSQSTLDLAKLFGVALNAVNENRGQLNSLNETNHPDHGDNVAHNLGLIKSTLESQQSQSPSDALRAVAQLMSQQGRGSTAPQYAQGLQQAADHFQGQQNMTNDDIGLLLHTMLGASSAGQFASQSGGMVGMMGAPAGQSPQTGGNDLVNKLAPAAMEFMRAKQSGADTKSAAMQAAMRAMVGGNPLQASSPGGASGGLIAQSIMKSLMGQ
jgi:dihydroxyacetone kinase-like protein